MSSQDYAPGSAAPEVDGPGDAELISAVRAGDIGAYGTLFARHADSARRLARQLVSAGDVDDLVSESFSKVLGALQRGGGPDLAFRAYLLTSMRRLHVDKLRAASRLTTTDDLTPYDPGVPFNDTVISGFENATAAKAFASLPERWQHALWHTEVEGQKPADIAPLLGISANSVAALAYRAREGLRQAFVTMHANDAADDVCATVRGELGAYIRGGTSRRTSVKIEEHLGECRECTAIYLELTEVNSRLGALLAPALLGTAGAGYLAAAHGVAAKGVLAGLTHWLLHSPAGKATAVTGGVAAAGVAVAVAVAASSGSPAPMVAGPTPPVSSVSSSPATPPSSRPDTPPTVSSSTTPTVVTQAHAAIPPVVAPSSAPSTPTPTPSTAGPTITNPPVAVTAPPSGSVVLNLLAGIDAPAGGLHIITAVAVHGTVVTNSFHMSAVFGRTAPATVTYSADPGWKGVDTVRYTVGDADGRTVSGTVAVTTLDAPPIASDFTAPIVEVTSASPAASTIPILSHASDANDDATEFGQIVTAPQHGTAKVVNGILTYTPPAPQAGVPYPTADTITYTVTDGTLPSLPTTVTIPLALAGPDARSDSEQATSGTTVSFTDLLANDSSLAGGLQITGVSSSSHASATHDGSSVTYTADASFSGQDSFSYTVTDATGQTSTATVTVLVAPAPVALGLSVHHPATVGYIGTYFVASGIPDGKSATFTMTIHGFLGWTPWTAGGICGTAVAVGVQTEQVTCTITGNGEVVHTDFFEAPGWYLDAALAPVGYAGTTAIIHLDAPPSP